MARVRQAASETASKRRSPTKERQQKAALRELVGPMGLLRAVPIGRGTAPMASRSNYKHIIFVLHARLQSTDGGSCGQN
jgi:hypothetical protein